MWDISSLSHQLRGTQGSPNRPPPRTPEKPSDTSIDNTLYRAFVIQALEKSFGPISQPASAGDATTTSNATDLISAVSHSAPFSLAKTSLSRSSSSLSKLSTSERFHLAKILITSILAFKALSPIKPNLKPANINDLLKQQLYRALSSSKDSNFGILYIVSSPARPGLVKVGFTTGAFLDRKEKIEKECKIEIPRIYVTKGFDGAHRAEKLVHRELKAFCRPWWCKHCHRGKQDSQHVEWFEIDEETVIKVVERWKDFMLLNPYELDGKRELKTEWKLSVGQVEDPGDERLEDHEQRWKRWSCIEAPNLNSMSKLVGITQRVTKELEEGK